MKCKKAHTVYFVSYPVKRTHLIFIMMNSSDIFGVQFNKKRKKLFCAKEVLMKASK